MLHLSHKEHKHGPLRKHIWIGYGKFKGKDKYWEHELKIKLNEWVSHKQKAVDEMEQAAKLKYEWVGHNERLQIRGWNKEIEN